jgi:hypothetical protein
MQLDVDPAIAGQGSSRTALTGNRAISQLHHALDNLYQRAGYT